MSWLDDSQLILMFEKRKEVGFTLVELMVVLAVVAILASLLLPALSRARMAADKAVCINNEHQIGIALRLYVDDQEAYPYELSLLDRLSPKPASPGSQFWAYALEPYAHSKWPTNNMIGNGSFARRDGIFACPGFTRLPGFYADPRRDDPFSFAGNRLDASGAYGYNDHFLGLANDVAGEHSVPVKEARVLNPADMIAIADSFVGKLTFQINPPIDPRKAGDGCNGSISVWGGFWRGVYSDASLNAEEDQGKKAEAHRHNARFNVLFCDNHVEDHRPNEVFGLPDDQLRRWHSDNQPHGF